MKLFQRLLVAPAALGLLAPMTAVNATEVNLNDISNYSDIESIEFANSFDNEELTEKPLLLAGGEGMDIHDHSSDSFSSTTSASFSADFLIGAVDGSTGTVGGVAAQPTEAVSATYGYQIDLATSFTGEDTFAVSLDAGSGSASLGEADLNSGNDSLTVDGISYQFPVGDKTQVIVGDSIDGSSLFSTACAYGGFTNTLDDCGNGNSAITGPAANSVAASVSYDIGDGWTAALGYAGEGSSTDGLLTKAGQDFYAGQVAYTADSYGISLTMANIESATKTSTALNEYYADTTYYAVNAYWTPEETGIVPSISVGLENGNVEADETTETDTNQWFVGFQWDEAGEGVLGAAIGSAGAQATDDTEDLSMYEVFYTYPLNDSMTITPVVFVREQAAGTDDLTGLMVKTSFSF